MTAERYDRPPEVEAELSALPPSASADYLDGLATARLEVVVIARRDAASRRLRDGIDAILVERSLPYLRAAVRRHGEVPRGEVDEVEDEAMTMFWEEIQEESFFEVRFNLAMMRLAQRAGRRVRGGKQRQRERSAARIGSPDQGALDGDDVAVDVSDQSNDYAGVEDRLVIEAGLHLLPEDQARALALHYLMELPVFSQDPAVRTVAETLGYGERKTRQLLADGRAALRRWFEEEDGDE